LKAPGKICRVGKMKPNPSRKSNPVLCGAFIAFGALCLLGTGLAAILLKDGIIERVSGPPRVDALADGFKIASLNRQIEGTERDIEFQKKMPDPDEERKRLEETYKKLNKPPPVNESIWVFGADKAEKIKALEEKKQRLITERDDLAGRSRAKEMKPRTWGEFFDDYNFELLIPGVLPLGLFSFYFGRFLLGRRLPDRNPAAMTDLERRCLLFLPFALVFSAFGFFLFVWILSIIY
jgi:hypothetical protein